MDAFGPVSSIVDPVSGVEIIDARLLPTDVQGQVREIWHGRMLARLLRDDYGTERTCADVQCFAELANAFLDDQLDRRKRGWPELTFEEFSADGNAERYLPDYIPYPHLPSHWFGLRRIGEETIDGSLSISNIQTVRDTRGTLYLRAWPVAEPPSSFGLRNVGRVAGQIARFIMTNDFAEQRGGRVIDFVEWELPQDPVSRYVARPGNPYGAEVFEEMSDNLRVRFQRGSDAVDAPREVKRELRAEDDPADYPVRPKQPVREPPARQPAVTRPLGGGGSRPLGSR